MEKKRFKTGEEVYVFFKQTSGPSRPQVFSVIADTGDDKVALWCPDYFPQFALKYIDRKQIKTKPEFLAACGLSPFP